MPSSGRLHKMLASQPERKVNYNLYNLCTIEHMREAEFPAHPAEYVNLVRRHITTFRPTTRDSSSIEGDPNTSRSAYQVAPLRPPTSLTLKYASLKHRETLDPLLNAIILNCQSIQGYEFANRTCQPDAGKPRCCCFLQYLANFL